MSPRPCLATSVEQTYHAILEATRDGLRCPMNRDNEGPLQPSALAELRRAGRIMIEIYQKNWRRIVILDRDQRMATAKPPGPQKPWRVIDAHGPRMIKRAK